MRKEQLQREMSYSDTQEVVFYVLLSFLWVLTISTTLLRIFWKLFSHSVVAYVFLELPINFVDNS